ncbi:unnamed protein product [Chondrus crispus]|uniref:Glutathione-disulfide reductase n=1 Tax=Chondrus crispus TaxID=2769 RepID=R7QD07_CHOCR|nr:unnamed protein product [Chondrus crispus]CDF36387.1 unnamed protein product [Chondrus crispus]|eukprot:XP_005716206.1 unnamed protein product [Chondrus crispus]
MTAFVPSLAVRARLTTALRSSLCARPSPLRRAPHPPRRAHVAMGIATDAAATVARDTLAHGFQYDLFVIGAGSGGVRASRIAANYGARVVVAESGPLGGTCVNVGCVPKKLFVYGSHYGHDFDDAKAYGWDVPGKPTVDWPRMIATKNAEIERLNGIYGRMLGKAGVQIVYGHAKLLDPHTVQVGEDTFTADKILVATGGKPFVPEFEGREHVITSNEAFYLPNLPKRVCMVGGGYIAVEFAHIFSGYGSDVVLSYRKDLFMRGFDMDVRTHLAEQMELQGIDLRFKTEITKVVKNPDGSLQVTLNNGQVLETDLVMYATGRVPLVNDLGLEAAGVATGKSDKIIVDDWSKTNVDNIYAIGDVTDRVCLTPVAIHEGNALADTLYGNKKRNTNYDNIPTAVFSTPTIGTCGLTEEQAREKYGQTGIDVYKTKFNPMKHTMTKRTGEKVFMKLIVDRATDVVVGCHMMDAAAGDMIQLVGVAMKAGATKADFDATMPVHPVSAEEIVTLKTKEPDP